MSTRPRPRQTPPDSDVYDDEFGGVSDADIDAYIADQDLEEEVETEKESGFLNLQTASGLGLIGLGALYTLQLTGLVPFFPDLSTIVALLPVLASVLIMLTGFGVLSWSPAARRRRKARERAAKLRRESRKTMGRAEPVSARRASPQGAAGAAASAAFGVLGKAALDAGRSATRAAEVAFAEQQARARRTGRDRTRSKRLTKDRRNRKISGVAAGIAAYTGLDVTLVRIAFVALGIFSQGIAIPLYFVLAMLLPNAPRPEDDAFDEFDDDPYVRVSKD